MIRTTDMNSYSGSEIFYARQRSMILMLFQALHRLAEGCTYRAKLEFSVRGGYYIHITGDLCPDDAMIAQAEAIMKAHIAADTPIIRRTIPLKEALTIFHENGDYAKERLFRYRRISTVSLYRLEDYEDYFYGTMFESCGALGSFGLQKYKEGLLLLIPGTDAFLPQDKVFSMLMDRTDWADHLDAGSVGALNDHIVNGSMDQLILIQEAQMEDLLSRTAAKIAADPAKKIILIAGPSSSGKTTFSHRLSIQLMAHGLTPHPIPVDNYFKDRDLMPRDEDGNYNFEELECIDLKLFSENMLDLIAGRTTQLPVYNFKTGKQELNGPKLTLGPQDVLVLEGIHCLNPELTKDLPDASKYRIYLSALTTLNLDDHNRMATSDGRLLRRMVRDARTRNTTAAETLAMWPSVRRGEEKNIFPFQEEADVMFNSSLIYEISVLKQYAEPLLFSIKPEAPEYPEAVRLLKLLDYVLGLDSNRIPPNSILREFIGGSLFPVG